LLPPGIVKVTLFSVGKPGPEYLPECGDSKITIAIPAAITVPTTARVIKSITSGLNFSKGFFTTNKYKVV
jgi:hypothetical protein